MSETSTDPNELSRRIVTKIERSATELPRENSGKVRGIRSADLKRLLEDSLRPERDRFRAEEERYKKRMRELEHELELVRAQSAETRRRELPRLAQLVEEERTHVGELKGELEGLELKLRSQETELAESKKVRRDTERHSAELVRELQDLRRASSSQLNETSDQAEQLLLALDSRIAELENRIRDRSADFEATQQIDLRERNERLAEQAERVRVLEDSVWEALEGATPSGQVRRRVREERRAAEEDPEQARVLLLRELVRRQQDQDETLEGIQLTLQNYEARLMSLEHRQRSDAPSVALDQRLMDLEGRNSEDGAWLDHMERRLLSLETGRPADGRTREVAQRTDEALARLEVLLARSRGEDPAGVPPPRLFAGDPAGAPPSPAYGPLPRSEPPSRAYGPTGELPSRAYGPTGELPSRAYGPTGEPPSRAYGPLPAGEPPSRAYGPLPAGEPPSFAYGPAGEPPSRTYPSPAAGPPPPRSFSADPVGIPPPSGAYALPGSADAYATRAIPLGTGAGGDALENTSRLAASLVESLRKQEEIKELLREALYQESPELALSNGEGLVDGGYSADIQPPFSEIRERAIRACVEGIGVLQEQGRSDEAHGIRDLLAWLHSTPQAGEGRL